MMRAKRQLIAGVAVVLVSGAAQATLFDRGGGMLYDDVLNITWLQDANYAKTSGHDADGRMNWSDANTWAANLVYGGYSDWRLASNTPVGAAWNYNWSYDGSTDYAFNISSPHSEMSYMYYVNLGLKGWFNPDGSPRSDWGIFGNGTGQLGDQADVGLVNNLQSDAYWSGTTYAPDPANAAWSFYTDAGFQDYDYQGYVLSAWAVRPGDVAAVQAVPEPATVALLGLALGGLVMARRRGRFDA